MNKHACLTITAFEYSSGGFLKNSDLSGINDPLRLGKLLKEEAARLHINLSEQQIQSFLLYYQELKLWNAHVNLMSSSESAIELFIKHFLDSLTLIPFIPEPHGKLIDIGTGGGFPGIPLKIALNSLEVTLLEVSRKKVSFLKSLRRLLNIPDLQILQERVEVLIENEFYRNRFDLVVSRAALKLPEYLPIGSRLTAPGGRMIAMKGANYMSELSEVRDHLEEWRLALAETSSLTLPMTGEFRALLIFERSDS